MGGWGYRYRKPGGERQLSDCPWDRNTPPLELSSLNRWLLHPFRVLSSSCWRRYVQRVSRAPQMFIVFHVVLVVDVLTLPVCVG